MKLLLSLMTLLICSSSYAHFFPNHQWPNASWQYSAQSCYAYTQCPDGRMISCNTYGLNYSNVPSYMSNQCRAFAVPGRFVQCQGYVQQSDRWGNFRWISANIPVSCPVMSPRYPHRIPRRRF